MIILSLIWFWFGWYICNKNLCGQSAPMIKEEVISGSLGVTGEDCDPTLVINDKGGDFNISSTENFHFKHGSFDLLPPTSDMLGVINQLTDHLSDNSDRFMQIEGFYHQDEQGEMSGEGLGKARATSVRSYLMSKGIAAAQLTIASEMNNEICRNDERILNGISVSFNKIPSN